MLLAVPTGLASARWPRSIAAARRPPHHGVSVAGVSMPVFFIGLILIQYVG
jgi:ABC-type dipeptide/oligopeptide/nickel transport system permease component